MRGAQKGQLTSMSKFDMVLKQVTSYDRLWCKELDQVDDELEKEQKNKIRGWTLNGSTHPLQVTNTSINLNQFIVFKRKCLQSHT